jgi:hypothetical protein
MEPIDPPNKNELLSKIQEYEQFTETDSSCVFQHAAYSVICRCYKFEFFGDLLSWFFSTVLAHLTYRRR